MSHSFWHCTVHMQPETRKLQQVCYHQVDIRMRSHRLLQLDDNKSVTSCCMLLNRLAAIYELRARLMQVVCFINLQQVCKYQDAAI